MKASESTGNFKSRVREYANYSARSIKRVCKEIGPRPCGSDEEKRTAEYMMNEFKSCSDSSSMEEFTVHPSAFLGWFKVDAVALIFSMLCLIFGLTVLSYIGIAISVFCLIAEFVFYKEAIDIFYPKKTSYNAYATKKATVETRRHIIFAGHMDSSFEWRPTYYGGKGLLYATFAYAILGLFYIIFATIFNTVKGYAFSFMALEGASKIVAYVSLAFLPAMIMLFFFLDTKRCVQGANDNLTGVFGATSVIKFMQDNGISFEYTDVSVLASGGEEAGLRGAKAFAKAHIDELKAVETAFIAADTLRDYETFAVYSKDMSGLTKQDPRICALVKKAGELSDIEMEYANLFCGASDAAAVSQAGVPAVCLAAMDPGPPRYYHTRLDTADNLELKSIEKGIEILINCAFLFDEQGLKESY